MLFFILPIALTASIHMWAGLAVILASVSTSLAYHITENKKVFYVDRICAMALIVFCWVAVILGHFPYPYFEIALALGAVALTVYFYQERPPSSYHVRHTIWHIFSAFVVTFSVVAYIVGTIH